MYRKTTTPYLGLGLASLMCSSDRVVIHKAASAGKSEMLPRIIRDDTAVEQLQHQRPRDLPIIRR